MDLDNTLRFLERRSEDLVTLTLEHALVVFVSLAIATVLGVLLGVLVWDKPQVRSVTLSATGIAITIPSLALLAILSPLLGLGWRPTVTALSVYALLPVVRNTVVGLNEVPAYLREAAQGIGMSRARVLASVQLPMAWPLVLAGIRVSAQLTVGVAAIGAYVAGPGLGTYIFKGLTSLGSRNALNYALSATVLIILLALVIDALFVLLGRLTTPKGLKA